MKTLKRYGVPMKERVVKFEKSKIDGKKYVISEYEDHLEVLLLYDK